MIKSVIAHEKNQNLFINLITLLLIQFLISLLFIKVDEFAVVGLIIIFFLISLIILKPAFFIPISLIYTITALYVTLPEVGFYRLELASGNIYTVELLVALTYALLTTSYLVGKKDMPKLSINILDLLLVAWIIALIFSAFYGIVRGNNLSNIIYEMRFLIFASVYFLASKLFIDAKSSKYFVIAIYISIAFLAVIMLMNVLDIGSRVQVGGQTRIVIGEHASFFCYTLILSVLLFIYHKKYSLVLFFGALISLIGVFVSYQRTSYVQVVFGLFLLIFLIDKKYRLNYLKTLGIISAVILILYLLFFWNVGNYTAAFSERVSTIQGVTKDYSIVGRYIEYYLSLKSISIHLVQGTGMGTALDYMAPSDYGLIPIHRVKPHNEYLWMAMKAGVPIMLFFMFTIFVFIRKGLKTLQKIQSRLEKAILISALIGVFEILLRAFFEDTFHKHRIIFMFFLFLGIISAYLKNIYTEKNA